MRQADLTIFVIPNGVPLTCIDDYTPQSVGAYVSTDKMLSVNKTDDGFSIIWEEEVIKKTDHNFLIDNIVNKISKHFPGVETTIDIIYLSDVDTGDEEADLFNMDTAEAILLFDVALTKKLNVTKNRMFHYRRSQDVKDVAETYDDYQKSQEAEYREKYMGNRHLVTYGDADNALDILNRAINHYDDEYDDDDSHHKKRGKRKRKDYDSSRVVKNARHPKLAYHRHGVIIADSKDDIRKDRKIIRRFLKDFIPGSAGWKRDLREDLEGRWLKTFVVTERKLKRLEKAHKRMSKKEKDKSRDNVERTIEITRRMFNVPIDNWNNPNK